MCLRRKLSVVPDEGSDVASIIPLRRDSEESIIPTGTGMSSNRYEDTHRFSIKEGMTLHPHPAVESPYMLSYNRIQLENESYTNLLLRRLNENQTPSFHDYGEFPPSSVLDLGCGQGEWLLEASSAWSKHNTKVTGLDFVDVLDERAKSTPGVSFKGGNFVTLRIPFKRATFDLVRIANLTLCVPRKNWEHVLTEVKRVLRPNGRVEIIDDELMFPYIGNSTPPHTRPATIGSSTSRKASPSVSGAQTQRSSWDGSIRSISTASEETHASTSTAASTMATNDKRRSSSDFSPSFLNMELDSDTDEQSIESAPGLYSSDSQSNSSCEDLKHKVT